MMSNEEKVALKLIEALELAYRLDANILNFIISEVRQAIENLDLPNQKCKVCGKEISWFEFHMNQGYCEDCAWKLAYEEGEELCSSSLGV